MFRWCVALALILSSSLSPAVAGVRRVTVGEMVRVGVPAGSGAAISLHGLYRSGERVTQVVLADPTEIAVVLDQPPPNTRVIYLRRLKPVPLPLQTRTGSGDTNLMISTTQRLLVIRVGLGGGDSFIELTSGGGERSEGERVAQQLERGLSVAIQTGRLRGDSGLVRALTGVATLLRQGYSASESAQRQGITMATVATILEMGAQRGTVLERLRR